MEKQNTPSPNLVRASTIEWYAQRCGDRTIPGAYRQLALGMEEALKGGGVSLEKQLAIIVTNALWELADRIELEQ